VIFTGYINNQTELTCLYKNCYAYIHGHEFGGTNPTMINALFLNCQIIALNTVFNKEMLKNKIALFFEKNKQSIKQTINSLESKYNKITDYNKKYSLPSIYDWDYISIKYIELFLKITNYQSK